MKIIFLAIIPILFLSLPVNAQLRAGLSGSFLQGQGNRDNHSALAGAGLSLKYFMSERLTIGGVYHSYLPRKSSYRDKDINYTAIDVITNVSASVDFMFGNEYDAVQPYIGMDVGMSFSSHNITYRSTSNKNTKITRSHGYLLTSPKAGLTIAITEVWGLFGQLQYNYSIGNGSLKSVSINDGKNKLSTEPISKYVNLDAGIWINL